MHLPKVIVIDAGLGNIGSVVSSFKKQECEVFRYSHPDEIISLESYSHVVLPGVGTFFEGMFALKERGWDKWIKYEWRDTDRPLLGICLGMQLLANRGEEGVKEMSSIPGLSQIPGDVKLLELPLNCVLPHIGWSEVNWNSKENSLILKNIPNGGDFYFVHSYAFNISDKNFIIANTKYSSIEFPSIVGKGLCFGTQFHPEKSQILGKRLITNFLKM